MGDVLCLNDLYSMIENAGRDPWKWNYYLGLFT